MKLQTSHTTARRPHRYSGVYQQQGRMITDADWNQLSDIEKSRLESALRDAIASGAPGDGGMALVQDGDQVQLVPGVLYAEGIPAHLPGEPDQPIGLDEQPDFPGGSAPESGPAVLYADVWERCVTALEDDTLLDPALHGADTTGRTETMLQVKWCEEGVDPLNPERNPPQGQAPLSLQLRQVSVGDDPCDPCASEADLDERVGNYLFRVEVHDVVTEDESRQLVLKWSQDNGAEAHRLDDLPPGFDRGDWVWEFYSTRTEKLLGHHFNKPSQPNRGALTDDFSSLSDDDQYTFVRQWDGFARIDLDSPRLLVGVDRGTTLSKSSNADAHGHTELDGGVLLINGERLVLRLQYDGHALVPGDYWQAAVRETVSRPGDFVLGSETEGEPPLGIRHHYVRLGEIDSDGQLKPQSDPEYRQFHFPPLTDLTARDIGYPLPDCNRPTSPQSLLRELLGERWPDRDGDGETHVQAMLDTLLCQLSSATLPHPVSACEGASGTTLRSALGLSPGAQPLAMVLNQLLCNTNATHVPLDKSDEQLCADLRPEDVVSVQDALKVLCQRETGSSCARAVEPGELENVVQELIQSEASDVWLCLKPGEHHLTQALSLTASRLIRIVGAGANSTQLTFRGERWQLSAPELHIAGLTIRTGDNLAGQWQLAGQMVHLDDVQILASEDQPQLDLVHIFGTGRGALGLQRLDIRRSRFQLSGPGAALKVEQVRQQAFFRDNYIIGELHYSHAIGKAVDPDRQQIGGSGLESEPVGGFDSFFHLENNIIMRWVSLMESGTVNRQRQLTSALSGPHTLHLTNNALGMGSSVTAKRLIAQGNQVFNPGDQYSQNSALWLFSNQLIANGHIGESANTLGHYLVHQGQSAVSNNLMTFTNL